MTKKQIDLELTYDEFVDIGKYTSAGKPHLFKDLTMRVGNKTKKVDLHLYYKEEDMIKDFLIYIPDHNCFIDDVYLYGTENELCEELKDINNVISLGIDEVFFFEKFVLIPEDDVGSTDWNHI
jgi:hypothetical protein